MSERKVLNKYYPPDFDPAKIPRRKGGRPTQQVVRLMTPFSMRCNTCGEYIYKGKKFNARKETVEGEDYYGIKIFRFYIKCTLCSAEITFKTDPKNTDYTAEHGASRNFEPWREEKAIEEEDRLAKLEEEENNPMKALENRTLDSKREMDILDALGDIRARNARNERVSAREVEDILERAIEERVDVEDLKRKRDEEEDEELVRQVFAKVPAPPPGLPIAGPSTSTPEGSSSASSSNEPATPSTITVKRKADGAQPDLKDLLSESTRATLSKAEVVMPPPAKKRKDMAASLGIKVGPKNKAGALGIKVAPKAKALV
ncbi:DUF572-domain-containing protein [Dacryopinax primogenitus]|uniref:Splicing factor YJU2 n=1 Tax=Dacryopinax primogenitus (strain DJM 731) TaxID=1858805 RepID=M5GEU0_DACPD|nr:DUF572-domain-containing protein [Dacryopinax primogenitus]EJU05677.1 DUF572-domain-containing protein [Dacryopinax primogenitus]